MFRRQVMMKWPDGCSLHFWESDETVVKESRFGRSTARPWEKGKRSVMNVWDWGDRPILTILKDGQVTEMHLAKGDEP